MQETGFLKSDLGYESVAFCAPYWRLIGDESMSQQKSCVTAFLALGSLLGILGLTAISLLTSHYGWKLYLEVFSHFQLQYLILSLFSLIILALTRYTRLFLVGLICTTLLATQIVTWYWPPKFLMSGDRGNFRILIANVNTRNKQYAEVLAFTRQEDPDLALFMEVDEAWITQLNDLSQDLPYFSGEGRSSNFGIALYSRYAFEEMQLKVFGDDRTPSLVGELKINNQPLFLVGTHPLPPARSHFFHSRNRQLDLIGQHLQTTQKPQLLIGDLNISMWSPYYKRLMRQTGLKNARKGFGLLPSWPTQGTYPQMPTWMPLLFSIPIDHCLLSSGIEVVDVYVGPKLGSDHHPLVVDLRL
ncbi:MAG: endonuclease/exonuclease/phosphatase family protein [Leptolyngbya sp. SIO1D8]|nr:endonuclease/exonuclease/phosphatase family protein [Leptolyngbya sp. SIO1D8]